MNAPRPEIGRQLLFHPAQGEKIHTGNPQAALITAVIDPNTVNLSVFDESGKQYPALAVNLYSGQGRIPNSGQWCEWPSYTLQQAQQGQEYAAQAGQGQQPARQQEGRGNEDRAR